MPTKDFNLGTGTLFLDGILFALPISKEKPIKIIYENEYPCPVSNQLGFNHHCKYVDIDITEKDMTLSCTNIGCEECFLRKET